jgi:hypothetical protein
VPTLSEKRKGADDSEGRHWVQTVRERREDRIRRFAERQQRLRDWINFAEIAEWCSELGGSIVSDEDARTRAYEKLHTDLMAGDFEEAGKTRVLYLHPWTTMAKVTRDRARDFVELAPPETLRSEYWDHCWIPRHIFHRWLAKHNLPALPSRFEPTTAVGPSTKDRGQNFRHASPTQSTRIKRGRRGPAPGTLDRFREVDRALYREIERIVREDRKSVSAAALELAEAGRVKGPGTAASRAKRLATRFRKERAPTSLR